MARVFLGRDEVLDRPVAIKILRGGYSETDIGLRFQREGRMAAKLSHPNIVQVYDAGETEFEGRHESYIIMEYVPGGDLKYLIQEKVRLSEPDIKKLGMEISSGLAHAHEQGIIHRDLKPHNVLITGDGRAKLTDFGIAHALDATRATRTGAFLGTALYASPEQLQGERVTPQSDIYSLGVTLYYAAVGEPPFEGSPLEVANKHISASPVSPMARRAVISGALDELILKCMNKDPAQRPSSAVEIYQGLAELNSTQTTKGILRPSHVHYDLGEPASGLSKTSSTAAAAAQERRATSGAAGRRWWRNRPAFAVGVALLLMALSGVAAFAAFRSDNIKNTPAAFAPPAATTQPAPAPSQRPAEQPAAVAPVAGQEKTASVKAPVQSTPSPENNPNGSQTAQAASQAVVDMYQAAAAKDYGKSWDLLSSRFQREEAGSQQRWAATFSTLKKVEFVQGPESQVSNGTARVTFVDLAYHTDRTEQNTATWLLVYENGGWKLDRLLNIQTKIV